MPKSDNPTPNREQHTPPKIVQNDPAATVAEALANNAAAVDATKKKAKA